MKFLLVLLCLTAGHALRRGGALGPGSHLGLNAWLVYVAVPAAALLYVPRIDWSLNMVWPVLMPILIWIGAWLVLGRVAPKDDPGTRGALLLGCGLGNTSFVGFPIVLTYHGEPGLQVAVVCDQVSFLLLSTLGVATSIAHGSGDRQRGVLAGLVRFPPFLAFAAALLFPGGVSYGALPELWEPLAATLVPVALFSVGIQLDVSSRAFDRMLGWGLLYKLAIGPALVLAMLWFGGASGLVAKVTLLEASMAAMATTSVLAVQYGLNTRVSNLLIGVGVPLSLLTSHLWWRLGEMLF